jgi:putative ABC transport system permease protein
MRPLRVIESLLQDLRYAFRRMRRQPGFTALIALTLALGVGANAAMWGFVDHLLFRTPPHVRDARDLVMLENLGSYPRYRAIGERLQSLDLAAFTYPQAQSLGAGAAARQVAAQCVSDTYFRVLGVPAHRGRTLTAADLGGGERPIVLSHAWWLRHLGGDPNVVGTTVMLSRKPHRVIGVAPDGFRGIGRERAEAWTLIGAAGDACPGFGGPELLRAEEAGWLTAIGRPRPGLTAAQAAAELEAIESDRPPFVAADGEVIDTRARLAPMYPSRQPSLSRSGQLALWLAGGAGVLLLLACANVAGLLSMRAVDRRREVAIRLQLGGSRARVFTQLLAEHLVMTLLGAALAVLVARWLASAFSALLAVPDDVARLDARMVAILAALAMVSGLASGTFPALQATRRTLVAHLRTGQGVVRDGLRARGMLLAGQVALALLLVAAAGLFVRSLDRFRADFAYDIDRALGVELDPGAMDDPPAVLFDTFEQLQAAARRLPQVERAELTSASGSLGLGGNSSLTFIGRRGVRSSDTYELASVTPGYFAALGLRMARGRAFTAEDTARRPAPVILNTALARELFGAGDPVGDCVEILRTCHEVIGVVDTFRATMPQWLGSGTQAFLPLRRGDEGVRPDLLVVRTSGPAHAHVGAVAAALQAASPDLPFVQVRPLTDLADVEARSWRLGSQVFGLFGALAVLLAGVGIYGALAFAVRQRTVEIGVRMALGAAPPDILRLVFSQGGAIVAAGLVLGIGAALAAARYVEAMLFNVPGADPRSLAIAAAVILAAALLGCLVPAVRATRVDPAEALRRE